MTAKLIAIGSSHLSAAVDVAKVLGEKKGLETVFFPVNWIDRQQLFAQLERLSRDEPATIQINRPAGSYSVEIELQEVHGVVTCGMPFSGPGDLFRAIAAKSFTGSANAVPTPAEVCCLYPVSGTSVPLDDNGEVAPGLVSIACLREIFGHWLDSKYNDQLSKLVVSLSRVRRVAHIPSPPMPGNTVIHRFGRHVFESGLGELMNTIWNRWADTKRSNALLLPEIPEQVLEQGWLQHAVTRAGYKDLEIHGNRSYGLAFLPLLDDWFAAV